MDEDDMMKTLQTRDRNNNSINDFVRLFLGRFKTTAYLVEKEDDHVVNQREITKVLPISRNQSFTFKLQTIITSPGEEISRSIKW